MTTYTVSTDLKAKPKQGRYVVTAEHEDGYEILYRTHDLGRCQPQASKFNSAQARPKCSPDGNHDRGDGSHD